MLLDLVHAERTTKRSANKTMVPYWYQQEAIDAVFDGLMDPSAVPLVVIPTGGGKGPLVGWLAERWIQSKGSRVINAIHTKELVEQNYETFVDINPSIDAGVFSASLGRKDYWAKATFGNIQSMVRAEPTAWAKTGLLIIDECHLLPHREDGQYQSFISMLRGHNPGLRIVGLTATPWRLDSGNLLEPHKGQMPLFNHLAYELDVRTLVDEGRLCPLVARGSTTRIDASNVAQRAGEFVTSELEQLATDEINAQIVHDTLRQAADRKSILVFGISVDHCERLRDAFRAAGVTAEMVEANTPARERDSLLRKFKAGDIRVMVNVSILTTGFNYPGLDCIVMARPTASPGLYIQIVGRGARVAPGKKNCLVLDYAGNTVRHGLWDNVKGVHRQADEDEHDGLKECRACGTYSPHGTKECPDCGTPFPAPKPRPNLEEALFTQQTTDRLISDEADVKWVDVVNRTARLHITRQGGNRVLQIKYYYDEDGERKAVSEYLHLEAPEYSWICRSARQRWTTRCLNRRKDPPASIEEALNIIRKGGMREVPRIRIKREPDSSWWNVDRIQTTEI